MKVTFASVIAFAAVVSSASAHSFSVCSGVTDQLGVKEIALNDDTPSGGEDLQVTIGGTAGVTLQGGEIDLKVKVLGLTVGSASFDLCKDVKGLTCPVNAGDKYSGVISYTIPSSTPAGIKANVEADVKDEQGKVVSCVDMKVTTGSKKSSGLLGATDEVAFLFNRFKAQYKKEYRDSAEEEHRLRAFRHNIADIISHNGMGHRWSKAINQFSDLTASEFKERHCSCFSEQDRRNLRARQNKRHKKHPKTLQLALNSSSSTPSSIDWVAKGAVTNPKNQGSCGSCWSFSTTGAIEGAYYNKLGNLVSFSEQMLVSCDSTNGGCNGGSMDLAFTWVKSNGLVTEEEYPYASSSGTAPSCSTSKSSNPSVYVTKYHDVQSYSEKDLMAAVANGPVSVAIEADQSSFQSYSGGVLTSSCGSNLDHGVLVVGYGTDNGQKYWKIKNSWGSTWGEEGYIRIARGNNDNDGAGQCGVLSQPSYPEVESA